jgi:hypothetical protein
MTKKPLFIGALLLGAALLLFPSALQTISAIAVISAVGIVVATRIPGTPERRVFFGGCAMLALAGLAIWTHFAIAAPHAAMAIAGAALSQDQIEEFQDVVRGLKGYGTILQDLRELAQMEGGLSALKNLPRNFRELQEENKRLRKGALAGSGNGSGVRWVGAVPFVTDDCAQSITSVFALEVARMNNAEALRKIVRDSNRDQVLNLAAANLGMELRAALTTTQIPVPTVFVPQIVELVFKLRAGPPIRHGLPARRRRCPPASPRGWRR